MVGAFRLITLITTPFPPVLHRPTSFIFYRLLERRISTASTRHISLSSVLTNRHRTRTVLHTSINSSLKELHAQAFNPDSEYGSSTHKPTPIHPWPEWSHFLDNLVPNHWNQSPGTSGHGLSPQDTFVVYEKKQLSEEFTHHASVCLAFARSRPDLLSFLARKDIEVIALNGTPFLFKSALDIARRMRAYLGMEGANVLEQNKVTLVDIMKYILSYASNPSISSKRDSLFSRELVESSVRSLLYQMTEACFASPVRKVPASEQHQFYGGNEQTLRPLRQNVEMKRGDWICPKCGFLNFARNLKCLECEESRPKKQLTGWEWQCPQCNFYNYGSNLVCLRCECKRPGAAVTSNVLSVSESGSIGVRLPENEEKKNGWFNEASQLDNSADHYLADLSGAAVDENFPEIMPLSKEENRSVVSARKTPLEVKLANCHSLKGMGEYGTSEGDISESSGHKKAYDSSKRPSLDQILGHSSHISRISDPTAMQVYVQTDTSSHSENKQAEKSEKWFQRVAELYNVKDLPSAISDEEFPEIMPMRKGENRFVVSKKKDRSLTSPAYKRHAATGQTSNSNFVPFVPFPPGYFARKDRRLSADGNSSTGSPTETSRIAENFPMKDDNGRPRITENNAVQLTESQVRSSVDWSPNSFGSPGMSLGRNTSLNSFNSHIGSELGTSRHLRDENASQSRNPAGGTVQLPNQNAFSGWAEKSLEGSAVKEPDHLDMSEEAKAERWFRRVAQIKDISELSQIPDEDFPSIMPMRKGVNRFVVSKRKTPLERRLTSQYRRNLPIERSHVMNKDNDNK